MTATKKTEYIECSCGSELITLEKWDDEAEIYLSIWERGYKDNTKLSWRERLRWCYRILRTGNAFGDQIVLNTESSEKLIQSIKKLQS